jgi:hypothetical protein
LRRADRRNEHGIDQFSDGKTIGRIFRGHNLGQGLPFHQLRSVTGSD